MQCCNKRMYAHGVYYGTSQAFMRYRCSVCRKTKKTPLAISSDEVQRAVLVALRSIHQSAERLIKLLQAS